MNIRIGVDRLTNAELTAVNSIAAMIEELQAERVVNRMLRARLGKVSQYIGTLEMVRESAGDDAKLSVVTTIEALNDALSTKAP